jgi:hypothetical protein
VLERGREKGEGKRPARGFIGVQARWMEGKRSAVIWALALHAQWRRRLAVFGRAICGGEKGKAPSASGKKRKVSGAG